MNPINYLLVKTVELMPKSIVRIFANKYIAGDTLQEAVELVKALNAKGIMATIDVLGEAISTREEALEAKNECIEVLETIQKEKLNSNLSIKPTQMGLLLDEDFCFDQVKEILSKAREMNNFIRLDMEDSPTTSKITTLFLKCKKDFLNVGMVIQAYLRRSLDDVKQLNSQEANYRLCKGIYVEPAEIAFKKFQAVRDNYLLLLREMLTNGRYVGIATHDTYLIEGAKKMIAELNLPKDKFEFQMLLGVREDIRDKLNAEGYRVRIYVPFGVHWYKYSIRRLKENPTVAWHIAKNVFSLH